MSLRTYLARLVPGRRPEQDPGFYDVILTLSRYGLRAAGILTVLSGVAFTSAYLLLGKQPTWGYGGDMRDTVVMVDKVLIVVLGVLCLGLSFTRTGPRWGRAVVGLLTLFLCTAMVADDALRGDATFAPAFLALALLVAVGSMPYRPEQTLSLGFGLTVVYAVVLTVVPIWVGRPPLPLYAEHLVYLVILTLLLTGMSALLYHSRFEQHRARRRAERLHQRAQEANDALEESMRRLTLTQDQLIQQEKMASLGRLTTGIAHELNNPLNFVNNFASLSVDLVHDLQALLADQPPPPASLNEVLADLQQSAERIHEHGARANRIVQAMMQHAEGGTSQPRPTDLNALVERHVHLAHASKHDAAAQDDVQIKLILDDAVGTVAVRPRDLGRVLLNLVENAVYAVRRRMAAGDPSYVPCVQVQTDRRDDHIEIRIRDNGPGIPATLQQTVFEPFFTTKPPGEGTGLGLSLSYEIITHGHNGTLTVISSNGEGATFTITLPAAPADTPGGSA